MKLPKLPPLNFVIKAFYLSLSYGLIANVCYNVFQIDGAQAKPRAQSSQTKKATSKKAAQRKKKGTPPTSAENSAVQSIRPSNEPDILSSDFKLTNFPVTMAGQVILRDYQSGQILFEKNADQQMAPSSMTKIATACLVEQKLKTGECSLDSILVVPEQAYRKEGSTMFLKQGQKVSVKDLLTGLIVPSGNDAAVALAVGLGGSEENFVAQMNGYVKNLGLTSTHFVNASGLPDPQHMTTARDLMILSHHAIKDYPEFYDLYKHPNFSFNGVTQSNRNSLLQAGIGCDGIKTGKTSMGGCGMVASTLQDDRRLILVVNGYNSEQERKTDAMALLVWGQKNFINRILYRSGAALAKVPVWYGKETFVPLCVTQDIVLTLPRSNSRDFKVSIIYDSPVSVPIKKGDKLGEIRISSSALKEELRFPLCAQKSIEEAGFFKRITDSVSYLIWGTHKPEVVEQKK